MKSSLFLEQEVTKKDDIYSVFNINEFRLGLFADEKMNKSYVFGGKLLW